MSTEAAAEAATDVVQKAAKPIGYIAAVIAGAIGIGWAVRKLGRALPLPTYLTDWAGDDEDQGDEEAEE